MSSNPPASGFMQDLRAVVASAYDLSSRQDAVSKGVKLQLFLLPFHRKIIQLYEQIVDLGELRQAAGLNTREHFSIDVDSKLHSAIHREIVHSDPLGTKATSSGSSTELFSLSDKWSSTLAEQGLNLEDDGMVHVFYSMVSCCIGGALSVKAELGEPGKLKRRAKRNVKFRQALMSGENSRAYLRKKLCKDLATELTDRVLKFLAVAVCPPIVQLKTGVKSEELAIPHEFQGLPTLDLLVNWRLQGLATVTFPAGKDIGYTVDTTDAMSTLGYRMEEAIIKNIGIASPALFPNPSNPDRLPYPAVLRPHKHHIRFLHLSIELEHKPAHTYPVQIFQAQDQLGSLLKYMPNLQVVTLTVVESPTLSPSPRGPYLRRGMKPGFTTIRDEMEKLVVTMRKLAVKSRALIYYDQNLAGSLTGATDLKLMEEWKPETEPMDVIVVDEDESEQSVVEKMMKNAGYEVVLVERGCLEDATAEGTGLEQATQALAAMGLP